MNAAPPGILERLVSLLIPPACREEVLGDLFESCTSPNQFTREALRVVPMLILSRIRRTADPQLLLFQATALSISFIAAAWYLGETNLFTDSGLLRLAIAPLWVLFGVILDDVYSLPGRSSILKTIRGPIVGLGLAYLSHLALSVDAPTLALPPLIMFYGSAIGLLMTIGAKLLFAPAPDPRPGAAVPALWQKRAMAPLRIAPEALSLIRTFAFILLLSLAAAELGGSSLSASVVILSVGLLIFRELRRRY